MRIIDTHMHVNFNGFSLRELIKYLDRERVDCCWLLSWEEINPGPWSYQHLSVEEVYKAYLKYPQRIVPFYAPDPHQPHASTLMDQWSQKGIRGCGELKATLHWDSEPIKAVLKTARKLTMPVVFHMEESREMPYSKLLFDRLLFGCLNTEKPVYRIPKSILTSLVNHYTPLQKRIKSTYAFPGYMLDFASLEVTLKDYQDVNFIAHGLMFWKHISYEAFNLKEYLPTGTVKGEGIIWRLLRDYPNFYADISGQSGFNALYRDTQNAKRFLTLFKDKILYGTDNVMSRQKDFLNSLNLSEGTYRNIYSENACRILKM